MKHAMSESRRQGGDQSALPVLHIITGLGFGGAERLLYNIASESVAAGHSILVVSLLPGGDFRPLFEAAGIEVMDLGMRRGRVSFSGLLRFVSILRARNPTVVQAWLYHANLLALVGLLLSGRRQQTTLLWGVYCTELPVSHYHWMLGPVRWLNARLSRLTDGVIYNARRSQDYHRAIGFREPRSLLLANSVNIERFKPSYELRREVRREMNIPEDAVVVIAVARVDPMKDWPNFMTAVRSLRNVITLAVGKGTEALPEQEGFVRIGVRDDVHRMLAAADIYALSSAFGEAQSVALTEAMACGLPVVTTNVGDAAFLVAGAGIVVPPRDAVALSAAIDSLARDPSLRQTLGAAARAQIVECHTARKIYETLQGTYAGLYAMSDRPEIVRVGPVHFQPLEWELKPVSRYLRGHLLNAGCGNRDISSYLRKAGIERLTNYDISSTVTGAVLGPLESMPFANAQFDSILCNAVLEHVTSAEAVVRELVRVLRPGGHAILTVPFLQPFHECPLDFRRYTREGLVALGEGAGLKAVAVHPVHSAAQTLGWIAWEIALERKSRLLRWVLWPVIYLATRIWIRTDPGILRNANTYQIVFTRS